MDEQTNMPNDFEDFMSSLVYNYQLEQSKALNPNYQPTDKTSGQTPINTPVYEELLPNQKTSTIDPTSEGSLLSLDYQTGAGMQPAGPDSPWDAETKLIADRLEKNITTGPTNNNITPLSPNVEGLLADKLSAAKEYNSLVQPVDINNQQINVPTQS
jgi:hypothetical protein